MLFMFLIQFPNSVFRAISSLHVNPGLLCDDTHVCDLAEDTRLLINLVNIYNMNIY